MISRRTILSWFAALPLPFARYLVPADSKPVDLQASYGFDAIPTEHGTASVWTLPVFTDEHGQKSRAIHIRCDLRDVANVLAQFPLQSGWNRAVVDRIPGIGTTVVVDVEGPKCKAAGSYSMRSMLDMDTGSRLETWEERWEESDIPGVEAICQIRATVHKSGNYHLIDFGLPVQIDGRPDGMYLFVFAEVDGRKLVDLTVDPTKWNERIIQAASRA